MKAKPVNGFEIPADDLDRTKNFYEEVFGLDLTLNEMGAWFPTEDGESGTTDTLISGDGYVPSHDGAPCLFFR